MSAENIRVTQLEYHRNGISGEGFYVARFDTVIDGNQAKMLAVVFGPKPNEDGEPDWEIYERGDWDNPRVAVFDETLLPDIRFGFNSWRGDKYAPALYKAIIDNQKEFLNG